jgi:predicted DNA-binding transcriptional regulator YafY
VEAGDRRIGDAVKIDRLLAIVLILLNRKKATAPELAERFGVSVRTIYRDIDTIDRAGVPIASFQGHGGGFGIVESYRLERQLLTPSDMLAMLGVLRGVKIALKDDQLDRSSKKIESLIPDRERRRLSDEVRIELSPWGYRGREDALLERLRLATHDRRLVRFTYLNSEGECSYRTVEPMTLVFKGSAWYLFAYCRLKADYRLFRVSRIRDLTGLNDSFNRRARRYDEFSRDVDERSGKSSLFLELKFSREMRFSVEDTFLPDQVSFLDNGYLIVRAAIPDGEWLYGWLLSYGEHVEVLAPDFVRQSLAKRMETILARYRMISPSA